VPPNPDGLIVANITRMEGINLAELTHLHLQLQCVRCLSEGEINIPTAAQRPGVPCVFACPRCHTRMGLVLVPVSKRTKRKSS